MVMLRSLAAAQLLQTVGDQFAGETAQAGGVEILEPAFRDVFDALPDASPRSRAFIGR
jgi:hypothetical protein